MPSPTETGRTDAPAPFPEGSRKVTGKVTAQAFALALLVASSLQIMENLVPRVPLFPWMRLGLSYAVILPFLLEYGPVAGFLLLLMRNLTAILYGAQPFSTFLIGSGAGAVSILGLGGLIQWAARRGVLGILGASAVLATTFNMAQLALVKWLLIRHAGFFFLIGPMLAWSLLSGTLVALLIRFSEADLARLFTPTAGSPGAGDSRGSEAASVPMPDSDLRIFLLGLLALISLFFADRIWIQAPALAVLLLLSPDRGKLLIAAWPFFFYIAWLHLFHTPGEYLFRDWVTYEGLGRFASNALRLANTLLLGRWLSRKFPWKLAERSESPYLQGFLLSLPMLANMFESSLEFGREMGRRLLAGQRRGILTPAFEAWRARMEAAARPSESQSPPL